MNRHMNTNATQAADLFEIFGAPIHTYTRTQALDDGVLIDFTDPESNTAPVCRQHYKNPAACTSAVFELMRKAVENPRYSQDYAGILHDMLFMSRAAGRRLDTSTVTFPTIIVGAGRSRNYRFVLRVGPGDQGEPVITIMLPDED